jgi:phosphohistidine phosphatase SixA
VGRHGHVDNERQLDKQGRDDAHAMAVQLRGVGFRGLLLSSSAQRAMQTAEIIKEGIPAQALVSSPYIQSAGEHPAPVANLHDFVGRLLTAAQVAYTASDIMVVTHRPLVDAVAGYETGFGQVYPVPDDWQNPKHIPSLAFVAEKGEPW